jgi:hypothetical protein
MLKQIGYLPLLKNMLCGDWLINMVLKHMHSKPTQLQCPNTQQRINMAFYRSSMLHYLSMCGPSLVVDIEGEMEMKIGLAALHGRVGLISKMNNYKQYDRTHKPTCNYCKQKMRDITNSKKKRLYGKQCTGLAWVCELKRDCFGGCLPDWAKVTNALITSAQYTTLLERIMLKYRPEKAIFLIYSLNRKLKTLQPHMKKVCDLAEDIIFKMYTPKSHRTMKGQPKYGLEFSPFFQLYDCPEYSDMQQGTESETDSDITDEEEFQTLYADLGKKPVQPDVIDLTSDVPDVPVPVPEDPGDTLLPSNCINWFDESSPPPMPLSKPEMEALDSHTCDNRCFHPTLTSRSRGHCSWSFIQKEISNKMPFAGWHNDPCNFCRSRSLTSPERWIDCTGDRELDEFKFEMFHRYPCLMMTFDKFVELAAHCDSLEKLEKYMNDIFTSVKYMERAYELVFDFIYFMVNHQPHMRKYAEIYQPLLLRNYVKLPLKPDTPPPFDDTSDEEEGIDMQ